MAIRLKDIAKDIGVSVVTISKALRNHPDISRATRERILQRVKELHYRPNLMARSLVTGRSELIGLVVPDLVHPFFSEIAKSLSAALRDQNFFLVVSSSDGDPTLEQDEIEHMLQHRLDALVVASCQQDPEGLRRVTEQGTLLILLDRCFASLPGNFVGCDDYQAGVLATEHLIASGRTRIAHIRGPENNVGIKRYEGYCDTIAAHHLNTPQGYIMLPQKIDARGRGMGENAMKQLLKLKQRPEAVFCFNDAIAVGALETAMAAGLQVPEDIAVIGCGNYYYSDTLRVPLSTIDQGSREMGSRVAKMILSMVGREGAVKPQRVILKPKLVARESTNGGRKTAAANAENNPGANE